MSYKILRIRPFEYNSPMLLEKLNEIDFSEGDNLEFKFSVLVPKANMSKEEPIDCNFAINVDKQFIDEVKKSKKAAAGGDLACYISFYRILTDNMVIADPRTFVALDVMAKGDETTTPPLRIESTIPKGVEVVGGKDFLKNTPPLRACLSLMKTEILTETMTYLGFNEYLVQDFGKILEELAIEQGEVEDSTETL